MIEKMTPSELYKKKQPLTKEEIAKIKKGAIELEDEEAKRTGDGHIESDIIVPKWQKKINENILRDDHEVL